MSHPTHDDPIVLAIIQDQSLLSDEYKNTQKKLKDLQKQLAHTDLDDAIAAKIQQDIDTVRSNFKAFTRMITEHAAWLEQEAKA